MIYVLETRGIPLFKLGYSQDYPGVNERLKSVQTGCPFELSVAFVADGGTAEEKQLHRFLHNFRTRGEWFRTTPGSVRILEIIRKHGGVSAVRRLSHLKSHEPEVFGISKTAEENERRAWEVVEQLEAEFKAFEARFAAQYRRERAQLETSILQRLQEAGVQSNLFAENILQTRFYA